MKQVHENAQTLLATHVSGNRRSNLITKEVQRGENSGLLFARQPCSSREGNTGLNNIPGLCDSDGTR
jgi:hypothetical protein